MSNPRERSLWELVSAAVLVGFLVGFVAVLCIGNYYRAKRAMERQRERRLRTQGAGSTPYDSPRSLHSSATESTANTMDNNERKHLLGRQLPDLPRRRGLNSVHEEAPHDLLLFSDRDSTEQAKIMRV